MTGQGVSATYDYDGHRRRVLITEPGAPRRVQFHNSAGLLLAEIGTNTSNTTTELKTYFYQGRNLVAERKRTLSQDTTHYVHSDHLGSPVARTNTVGYAYERTMYEPYGLKANSAPNGPYGVGLFPDGIGFAGHRVDRVSGLSYMQQRYYDPVAGRFISPDPVPADAGALFNRYAYAYNNPITLVDTDGRIPILAPAAYQVGRQATVAVGRAVVREAVAQVDKGIQAVSNEVMTAMNAAYASGAMWMAGESTGDATDGAGQATETETKGEVNQESKSGSYTNKHASGKSYHGKGSRSRASDSAKEKEAEYGDPLVSTDYTTADSDREAFKQESDRLEADGGAKSPSNYNKISSPGKKYNEQDSAVE